MPFLPLATERTHARDAVPVEERAADPLTASQSGERLEDAMEAAFRALGIRVDRAAAFDPLLEPRAGDRFVLLNAPYGSIYGREARVEFTLDLGGDTYLTEAKRQTSPGSVNEKLAFARLNALHNRDRRRFVLFMDGDGFREGARRWIEREPAADERFDVFSTLNGLRLGLEVKPREADG